MMVPVSSSDWICGMSDNSVFVMIAGFTLPSRREITLGFAKPFLAMIAEKIQVLRDDDQSILDRVFNDSAVRSRCR